MLIWRALIYRARAYSVPEIHLLGYPIRNLVSINLPHLPRVSENWLETPRLLVMESFLPNST